MKVLILCTGNSCRSQMAHGFLQALAPGYEVFSAGTHPAKEVHPFAVQVMAELQIDISKHQPRSVNQYLLEPWDLVWTVCGDAEENCPLFTGQVGKQIHLGFADPARFSGTPEEVLQGFRQVRDEIGSVCNRLINKKEAGCHLD
ncbi:MAG: protein tyrosine phosphatase [Candidatus Lambdaproteobacteria bacterium RIFOXYD2_FULL_50_16]|uniref:Protein tyrosine phosphatase n=1 Tax=Candidatus Lambdaproteobacteria bacterium RIFOXYD2_FULL_50_16 TaxID=1817772 RepID=A0A1F6G7F2_9PROT|nr:MAG: protein tyrosine phosphatase [Candidatus Lambdaproteobacteria bacterium RIFOXYD2_FULL_50_16]